MFPHSKRKCLILAMFETGNRQKLHTSKTVCSFSQNTDRQKLAITKEENISQHYYSLISTQLLASYDLQNKKCS